MTVDALRDEAGKAVDELPSDAVHYVLGALSWSQPKAVLEAVELLKRSEAVRARLRGETGNRAQAGTVRLTAAQARDLASDLRMGRLPAALGEVDEAGRTLTPGPEAAAILREAASHLHPNFARILLAVAKKVGK